jgi:hypothetical protein
MVIQRDQNARAGDLLWVPSPFQVQYVVCWADERLDELAAGDVTYSQGQGREHGSIGDATCYVPYGHRGL